MTFPFGAKINFICESYCHYISSRWMLINLSYVERSKFNIFFFTFPIARTYKEIEINLNKKFNTFEYWPNNFLLLGIKVLSTLYQCEWCCIKIVQKWISLKNIYWFIWSHMCTWSGVACPHGFMTECYYHMHIHVHVYINIYRNQLLSIFLK